MSGPVCAEAIQIGLLALNENQQFRYCYVKTMGSHLISNTRNFGFATSHFPVLQPVDCWSFLESRHAEGLYNHGGDTLTTLQTTLRSSDIELHRIQKNQDESLHHRSTTMLMRTSESSGKAFKVDCKNDFPPVKKI